MRIYNTPIQLFLTSFLLILFFTFSSHYYITAIASESSPETAPEATSTLPSDLPEFSFEPYQGKKLILFLFSIDDQRSKEAATFVNELHRIRKKYNFEVVGISISPGKDTEVQHFIKDNNLSFPVFYDVNKKLSKKVKMKGKLGLFVYSQKSRLIGGTFTPRFGSLPRVWRGKISRYIEIGYVPEDMPVLGIKPQVPLFEGTTLTGRKIDIKNVYESMPVIIVIFSPRCKNCRNELKFLSSIYSTGELKNKFEIVAISILNKKLTTELIIKNNYSFPVILDTERKISSLFPSYIGIVPVSFIVDTKGRINALHTGFTFKKSDMLVMELKKLSGVPNPPLLNKSGYSGVQRCGICHEKELIQWTLSRHSDAYLSLVRKGKERDMDCIACHVVGFDKDGGYETKKRSRHLEGVQCESCHGPGFQSCKAFSSSTPKKKNLDEWEKLCLTCHTEKESLNFVFSKRFPKILHINVPDLSSMDRDERFETISKFREKKNIFDNPSSYVGVSACKECHQKEFDHWKKTSHAGVHKTSRALSASPDEIFRYNTGYGNPGGYPVPGREGVQCEACHGPGEKHLKDPEAKGHGYIVSLGAECSSCVVEQICRNCHTLTIDPGFDFDKQINKVKHFQGTKTESFSEPSP